MNKKFYNGKITLIIPREIDMKLPDYVDLYIGTIDECYVNIKRYELDNDEFYNGHFIVHDLNRINEIKLKYIYGIDITDNVLYTTHVTHSPISVDCWVDASIVFCNSFVLSIVVNSGRTNNNLYGDCISHRIQLKTFNNEDSSLSKRTIT